MYNQIVLTLILLTLLWIALGLSVIASSIKILGKLIPTRRNLRALERSSVPWMAKMVVVKILSHMAIRYIGKRMK